MNPYPITNLAASWDGTATRFPELQSMAPAQRAAIESEVIALRQAAAAAVGEAPDRFLSVSVMPSAAMVEVFKSGPEKKLGKGLSFLKSGAEWRAGIIKALRSGQLSHLLKPGSVQKKIARAEEKVEAIVASSGGADLDGRVGLIVDQFGGDLDASLEFVIMDLGKRLEGGGVSAKAAAPDKKSPVSAPAVVAVKKEPVAAPAAPAQLSGRARAAVAFNAEAAPAADARRDSVKTSRPDLSGRALAAAAINAQFGKAPSLPPPRALPPMPKGKSRAAEAFNQQFSSGARGDSGAASVK